MPPGLGFVKGGDPIVEAVDTGDFYAKRVPGTPYTSAGGGETSSDGTFGGFIFRMRDFVADEGTRPDLMNAYIVGSGAHSRPPAWMEHKLVSIDGKPLSEMEQQQQQHWSNKYKRELDVAQAVQEVKRQRRWEETNDVAGYLTQFQRLFGLSAPLDESEAVKRVATEYKLKEEAEWLQARLQNGEERGDKDADDAHPIGVLPREQSPLLAELQRRAGEAETAESPKERKKKSLGFLGAPWQALIESVETGRPLAKVANEYRPRVDFYGLDPFLDSAPSFVWFSTKSGIAIGLVLGTVKAVQAMNVDVQFLRASGVGVLSILNMSVFANVVKWGGNMAIFSLAFVVGDRLMRRIKRRTLPAHDAEARSTANYVLGLSFSGATVGILPWWVLSDVALAARMATSGLAVGAVLGLMVGQSLQQLIALNTSRLEATNRQLRRYEALMHRERTWVAEEKARNESGAYVWW